MTITITGLRAAAIESAEHASFYGIWGNANGCIEGRRAAYNAVADYLAENNISYYAFLVNSTKTIDTTGTKIPYKAEINFTVDR